MTGVLQPLDQKFKVVNSDGTPTDYFIRWAQQRQIDIGEGISLADLQAYLATIDVIAGTGLTGGGPLSGDVTLTANAEAILNTLSTTQGVILYKSGTVWTALAPGTSGQVLKTNGAGADPSWTTPAGTSFRGALVYPSADLTSKNFTAVTILDWNTESYDTDAIHTPLTSTVTVTIASPGVVTWTAHGLNANEPVVLTTTGALPTGLTAGTVYYVLAPAANTFTLSLTPGGAAINTSGSQSGVHTGTNSSRLVVPSGITKVRVGCGIRAGNVTGSNGYSLAISKNNSLTYVGRAAITSVTPFSTPEAAVWTAALTVVTGDYFEATWVLQSDTSSDIVADRTWFAMELIQ